MLGKVRMWSYTADAEGKRLPDGGIGTESVLKRPCRVVFVGRVHLAVNDAVLEGATVSLLEVCAFAQSNVATSASPRPVSLVSVYVVRQQSKTR
jgi:hypothetical protein